MSKAQAIVEAEGINLAIVRGQPVDWLGRDSSKSWAAMYADFLSWVQKDNELASASRTKYAGVLTRLAHFLNAEGIRLNASTDFSERIARQYVEWREDTPVARNGDPSSQRKRRPKLRTVHDDVDLLRKMFERARERKWIAVNPFADIRRPKRKGGRKSAGKRITDAEVKRLLRAARKFDAAAEPKGRESGFRGIMADSIELMLETGLRTGEAMALPWAHFEDAGREESFLDIAEFEIEYEARRPLSPGRMSALRELARQRSRRRLLFDDDAHAVHFLGQRLVGRHTPALLDLRPIDVPLKGNAIVIRDSFSWAPKGKSAEIPLSPTAFEILQRRRRVVDAGEPFIFPHPHGGPLLSDFAQRFDAVRTAAAVRPEIRAHDLRHTFAMRLREVRTDFDDIRGLMRHSKLTDTELYAPYEGRVHGRSAIMRAHEARRQRAKGE
ncbi:MAG: tyrosine-type recombinase/integrase [Planctomycetota bacterium]